MRKKLLILILNCTIILLAATFCTFGQNNDPKLKVKEKKITIKMDNQPLGKVFEYLIVNYDVAIGFEESILDRDHDDYDFETNLPYPKRKIITSTDGNVQITVEKERVFLVNNYLFSVNIENGRLEDVLSIIVRQMRNYKWEVNDDVVNILPIRGRDPRYAKLLEVSIKNFNLKVENRDLTKGAPIFLIRNKIFELPEVINCLNENKIYYSGFYRESLDNLKRKIDPEMNFSNLKFKELLNKITKIKRGGWILKQNDVFGTKEKEYIEIDI